MNLDNQDSNFSYNGSSTTNSVDSSQFETNMIYPSARSDEDSRWSQIGSFEAQRLYSEMSQSQISAIGSPHAAVNTSTTLSNFSHIFSSKISVADFNSVPVGLKRCPSVNDEVLAAIPHKRVDLQKSAEKEKSHVSVFGRSDSIREMLGDGPSTVFGAMAVESPVRTGRMQTDFDIIEVIGGGVFGKVYKVVGRIDRTHYAIKVSRRGFRGEVDKKNMFHEVYALAAISSKDISDGCDSGSTFDGDAGANNIVRYFGTWIEDDRVYIQMELCDTSVESIFNGYLKDCGDVSMGSDGRGTPLSCLEPVGGHHSNLSFSPITKNSEQAAPYPFTQRDVLNIARDMLLALSFLHRNEFVHLDVKPGNILVKNNRYKLGDFGLAIQVKNGRGGGDSVEEGDTKYMARELLDWGEKDLTKCDVFSLGASLYELMDGEAIAAEGEQWHCLRNGTYRRAFGKLSNSGELASIVYALLTPDPVARLSAAQALNTFSALKSPIEKELEFSKRCVAALQSELTGNLGDKSVSALPGKGSGTTKLKRSHTTR